MTELAWDLAALFGWGLLTAISPCPLATNAAAISTIAGWSRRPGRAFLVGAAMILGIVAVYVGLAMLVAGPLSLSAAVVNRVRDVMAVLLGPLLILVGMVVAELLPLPGRGRGRERVGRRLRGAGATVAGGLALGLVIGLSFCPTTAAILFAVVIARAIEVQRPVLYPLAYGLGCVLPLMAVAALIVGGSRLADRLQQRGNWAERISRVAGWALIAVGIGVTVYGLR